MKCFVEGIARLRPSFHRQVRVPPVKRGRFLKGWNFWRGFLLTEKTVYRLHKFYFPAVCFLVETPQFFSRASSQLSTQSFVQLWKFRLFKVVIILRGERRNEIRNNPREIVENSTFPRCAGWPPVILTSATLIGKEKKESFVRADYRRCNVRRNEYRSTWRKRYILEHSGVYSRAQGASKGRECGDKERERERH